MKLIIEYREDGTRSTKFNATQRRQLRSVTSHIRKLSLIFEELAPLASNLHAMHLLLEDNDGTYTTYQKGESSDPETK